MPNITSTRLADQIAYAGCVWTMTELSA